MSTGLPWLHAGRRHAPRPRVNGSKQALEQACANVGLDADGARLLRLGSNAVYHLKTPVIVRVSRPGTDITPVRRSVAVARWLKAADYPAVRVIEVDQPVIATGYIVTFWESVSDDGDQFATTPEIAAILARLHHLIAPAGLDLPPLDPFANAAPRIDATAWLPPGDRSFLVEKLAELQAGYAGLEFHPPAGRHPRRRQRRQRAARPSGRPGPDRPRWIRGRPPRVGPDLDGDLLRQLRLAHPPGVRGLRPRRTATTSCSGRVTRSSGRSASSSWSPG